MQKDFDRPLNERGKRDAPEMAKRLVKREVEIDGFVSSPAKRAYSTAVAFADVFDVKEKHILKFPYLYEATSTDFYRVISELDNDLKTVAIFSHNPGITQFVNELTATKIDDMPTCAVFAMKCDIKKWKDFLEAEKHFWFFDFPKLG